MDYQQEWLKIGEGKNTPQEIKEMKQKKLDEHIVKGKLSNLFLSIQKKKSERGGRACRLTEYPTRRSKGV